MNGQRQKLPAGMAGSIAAAAAAQARIAERRPPPVEAPPEVFLPQPEQVQALGFVRERDRSGLWAAMGAGKTVVSLTAVLEWLEALDVSKVLVVAPKKVAREVWPTEIRKWRHTRGMDWTLIAGNPVERIKAMHANTSLHIVSRDNFPWLVDQLWDKWPYDALIFDESSGLKRPGTERFKSLRKVAKHFRRAILLSATPSPNSLLDIWCQIWALDAGRRLGQTFGGYKAKWFYQIPGTGRGNYEAKLALLPGSKEKIHELVKDVCLTVDSGGYKPGGQVIDRPVILSPQVLDEYRRLTRTYALQLKDQIITAANAAVLVGKLQQLACLQAGTEVLTNRGWVFIEKVTPDDLVWDGIEWVTSRGGAYMKHAPVVECDGVSMTPDHKVLTKSGWAAAQEILDGYADERFDREEVRLPDSYPAHRTGVGQTDALADAVRLRKSGDPDRGVSGAARPAPAEILRLSTRGAVGCGVGLTRQDTAPAIRSVEEHEVPLRQSVRQRLQKLRGAGDRGLSSLEKFFRGLFGRHGSGLPAGAANRAARQPSWVFPEELLLGYRARTSEQHESERTDRHARGAHDGFAGSKKVWPETHYDFRPDTSWRAVYDVVEAGPRHRFTVRGNTGKVFVVHNSGAMYLDGPDRPWAELHKSKMETLDEIVETLDGEPLLVAYWYRSDLERLKAWFAGPQRGSHVTERAVHIDEPNAVQRWNAGEIKILMAHPASAGHGLNLQHGGHYLAWLAPPWSLELFQQMNGRLDRQGQKHPVKIYRLVAQQTIDEKVVEVLSGKDANQRGLLDAARRLVLDVT